MGLGLRGLNEEERLNGFGWLVRVWGSMRLGISWITFLIFIFTI